MVTDGTAAGTSLFLDSIKIRINQSGMFVYNGLLYFWGNSKLYRTDGTAAGTFALSTTTAGTLSAAGSGGKVFFLGFNAATGQELWATDGTTAGTSMVMDIYPGAISSAPRYFSAMPGGKVFFAAFDDTGGRSDPWVSDGTPAGTFQLKKMGVAYPPPSPFTTYYSSYSDFLGFTQVGATTLFAGTDSAHGTELWKTNGTTAGTMLVKDIVPGAGGSLSTASYFTVLNGKLVFTATTAAGYNLWTSDGTDTGTHMIIDLEPANANADLEYFSQSDVFNNRLLYFSGHMPNNIQGIPFVTDGTAAGTHYVCDTDNLSMWIKGASAVVGRSWLVIASSFTNGSNGNELYRVDIPDADTAQPAAVSPAAQIIKGLRLSPNPSTGSIRVETAMQQPRYEVFDMLGRTVLSGTLSHPDLSLQGYQPGRYIIRVYKDGYFETGQIVLQ